MPGQCKGRISLGGRNSQRHVDQHHATIDRNSFGAPSTLLDDESHVYQVVPTPQQHALQFPNNAATSSSPNC